MSAAASSQRSRRAASSCSRAFSITTPAAAASATTSSSSCSVNPPGACFSVRYRLPKTLSRIRIGVPRNVPIGGWLAGKPYDAGWSWMRSSRSGSGRSMMKPRMPVPARQVADARALLVGQAVRHELAQSAVGARAEHAQGHVPGAGQLARDGDDPLQHAVQVQVADQAHDRVEQATQTLLRGHDLVDALQHLLQQLVEPGAAERRHRQVGGGRLRVHRTSSRADGGAGQRDRTRAGALAGDAEFERSTGRAHTEAWTPRACVTSRRH